MIIKTHRPGRSFVGVTRYLSHDRNKAETSNRVAWTHSLNLANNHVGSAVDEMIWLYRSADQLKREAGVSTRGAKLDKPVKHFSMSWHESESPTQDEMVGLVKRYLKHMGMEDRQAILFAHNDTAHPHVHVVVNVVSPVDGRTLKQSFEHRRAQAFALAYEREQGLVFCEERLKPLKDRAPSPTRAANDLQKHGEKTFERDEAVRRFRTPDHLARPRGKQLDVKEWEALKAHQKKEREAFFAAGKAVYRAASTQAYREVREQFAPRWKQYYADKRNCVLPTDLAAVKAAIQKEQKQALEDRRKVMMDDLRQERDEAYKVLLAGQELDRKGLTNAQSRGKRSYLMFDTIYPAPKPNVSEPIREHPLPPEQRGGWRVGEGVTDAHATAAQFRRAEQTLPAPAGAERAGVRFTRLAAPTVQTEGKATARDAAPAKVQATAPKTERTERAVETERVAQAREMTDQKVEKDQKQLAAMYRTSWARARRGRDRGD